MITVKRNFLSLSLVFLAVTGSLSAMEGNPEQLTVAQSAVSTCGQMVCNVLSTVKDRAHNGAIYAHDAINRVIFHMIPQDEEQNPVVLNTTVNLKNDRLSVYYAFCALQNGLHNGANYAHDMINEALIQIVRNEEL